jgi:hypothetical protein
MAGCSRSCKQICTDMHSDQFERDSSSTALITAVARCKRTQITSDQQCILGRSCDQWFQSTAHTLPRLTSFTHGVAAAADYKRAAVPAACRPRAMTSGWSAQADRQHEHASLKLSS